MNKNHIENVVTIVEGPRDLEVQYSHDRYHARIECDIVPSTRRFFDNQE